MIKQSNTLVDKLNDVVLSLDTRLKEMGSQVPENVAKGLWSLESADAFNQGFEANTASIREIIDSELREVDLQSEFGDIAEDDNAALTAATMAAVATQQAGRYHRSATRVQTDGHLTMESIFSGIGGEVDVASTFTLESFDDKALDNFQSENIVYNILAARQDSFAEAFFPTKVIPASSGGLTARVDRQEVISYKVHPNSGALTENNRRGLIEAYRNPAIINRGGVEAIPYARPDGSADAVFAPDAEIDNTAVKTGEVAIDTRPLLVGKKLNLLGLSAHPGALDASIMDTTDQLAGGGRIGAVYLRLDNDDDTVENIRINVSSLSQSQFRKRDYDGKGRDVIANLVTESIVLDKNTKITGGGPATLLTDAITTPDVVVRLAVSLQGIANLDQGDIEVNSSPVRVVEVIDNTGASLDLNNGTGKTAREAVENNLPTIAYWEPEFKRSNTNWRSVGTLIDVTPYTESYAVVAGNPITVLSPADGNEEGYTGQKLAGMINSARVRNSGNAVATLLNYAEALSAHTEAMKRGVRTDILGVGRFIVDAYYDEDDIDVKTLTVSNKSRDRADDVCETIVNVIRDKAWKMFQESNYGPALDMHTGGSGAKPKLLIGTDSYTARFLDRRADARLLGSEMDYQVVVTDNEDMNGKIVLTFTTDKPGTDSGLGFGTHAYVVELIQRINKTYNGGTGTQDRVIPRSIHVPALPVMSVINVENLNDALTIASN